MNKRLPKKFYEDGKFFDTLENLISIHCTLAEIKSILCTTSETLDKECKEHYGQPLSEVVERYRSTGVSSLRRTAWTKALDGDVKMITYLMSNYTETKNNPDTSVTINNCQVSSSNNIKLSKEDERKLAETLDKAGLLDSLFEQSKTMDKGEIKDVDTTL
jgi:hypothetical protein